VNATDRDSTATLSWQELPPLPNALGIAGPFVGVHNEVLLVAGGANFAKPVWDSDKQWHDQIHLLVCKGKGDAARYVWKDGGKLARNTAYGAAVSTPQGIVCIGGNNATETFDDVFLLQVDAESHEVTTVAFPKLPRPCAFSAAAFIGDTVYLAGGQSGQSLETAMGNLWSLDLAKRGQRAEFVWQQHSGVPFVSRALNLTLHQHDGDHDSVYVIGGRRQQGDQVQFLKDVWQYTPAIDRWRRRRDAPRSVMAGIGIDHGKTQLLVLGGADGTFFDRADELRDRHPGFPKQAFAYHTITDTWTGAGAIPQNHVTTIAVRWQDSIVIPSGEIRPRVRSPKVWQVKVTGLTTDLLPNSSDPVD
jgi:N-acetylneuraminic acid mutarotase